jgi:hypothetical protein
VSEIAAAEGIGRRPVLLAPRSGRASDGDLPQHQLGIAGEIWTTYDSSSCDSRKGRMTIDSSHAESPRSP